jgi:hypothetical protein
MSSLESVRLVQSCQSIDYTCLMLSVNRGHSNLVNNQSGWALVIVYRSIRLLSWWHKWIYSHITACQTLVKLDYSRKLAQQLRCLNLNMKVTHFVWDHWSWSAQGKCGAKMSLKPLRQGSGWCGASNEWGRFNYKWCSYYAIGFIRPIYLESYLAWVLLW